MRGPAVDILDVEVNGFAGRDGCRDADDTGSAFKGRRANGIGDACDVVKTVNS